MKVQEFIEKIQTRKGSNLSAVWIRPMKVRKNINDIIAIKVNENSQTIFTVISGGDIKVEKKTHAIVRGGVDYDNLQTVKEGRQDGTLPEENAGLPWGEWVQFPFHIRHKDTDYVRLYPASGINFTPFTEYFINGHKVSKDQVEALCLASEFKVDAEQPTCFTIKADNLVQIG